MSNKNQNANKKDNFNQAMSDMFGLGKGGSAPKAAPAAPVEEKSVKQEQPQEDYSALLAAVIPAEEAAKGTYIAAGTVILGTVKTEDDVEIAGQVEGDVISGGAVVVASGINGNITANELKVVGCTMLGDAKVSGRMSVDANSVVTGNVTAGELHCAGKITGDLAVTGNLALEQSAQVDGNIVTGTMTMARGSKVHGKIEMKN